MFKLESYITPILLSYVDRYIKNFKLEDSQVYSYHFCYNFKSSWICFVGIIMGRRRIVSQLRLAIGCVRTRATSTL